MGSILYVVIVYLDWQQCYPGKAQQRGRFARIGNASLSSLAMLRLVVGRVDILVTPSTCYVCNAVLCVY